MPSERFALHGMSWYRLRLINVIQIIKYENRRCEIKYDECVSSVPRYTNARRIQMVGCGKKL